MYKLQNKYSFWDKIKLSIFWGRTKLIDGRVRLFRFPIAIHGREFIDFGEKLTTGVGCRFDCFGNLNNSIKLKFGKNVQLNDYVHIVAMENVYVGDNVLMASHVFISDNSHGSYNCNFLDSDPRIPPTERDYVTAPVKICGNVWIGEGVCIMPGVTIGEGCVIGAHSIVSRDIPAFSIAVGTPAKVIKLYNFETKQWEKVE